MSGANHNRDKIETKSRQNPTKDFPKKNALFFEKKSHFCIAVSKKSRIFASSNINEQEFINLKFERVKKWKQSITQN